MPTGPKGQKRPADVIGNAVCVMQIATGEAVRIDWPNAAGNGYLEMLDETLNEWRSAEDEAAFGDLRPL